MPKRGKQRKKRVVAVVFDGGTWEIIKPLAKQGKMPTIASLLKRGKWGYLKSTFPPLTCPAWFSLSTGKNPGKLGMFNFFTMKKGSYEFKIFDNNDLTGHRELWDLLNEARITCAVINNPVAYPPKKVDRYMVAGFMTPSKESDFTYPPKLKEKLDQIADDYEIDSTHSEAIADDELLENALRVLGKRTKVFEFFMKDKSLDFLLLTYTATDRVCHQFLNKVYSKNEGEGREANLRLEKFFGELDSSLREVISHLRDEDYFFLFSDHGFGKRDKGFYINQWLIDNGYLTVKRKITKEQGTNYIKIKSLLHLVSASLPYRVLRFLLRRMGVWEALKKKLKPTPQRFSQPIEGEGISVLKLINQGGIDWKKTKAITIPGGIYLNTVDRPLGIVKEGERELLRDELIAKLGDVRDPQTGKKIKIEAVKPEDHYWGDLIDQAPDIQLVIEDYEWGKIRNISNRGEWVGDLKLAHHREEGMILVLGPGVEKGIIEGAEIVDLAPTILSLYNLAVPRDMDGKVLPL